LYDTYNTTTRAAHFSFLPLFALTPEQLANENITLNTDLEKFEGQRYLNWSLTGEGFFAEQSTKVSDTKHILTPASTQHLLFSPSISFFIFN
jgi:hypothetical protein